MVNVMKLKGLIVERGTTQEAVADALGINRSTFYRKMKNNGDFTVSEVQKLMTAIPISFEEASEIFFGNIVAKTQLDIRRT